MRQPWKAMTLGAALAVVQAVQLGAPGSSLALSLNPSAFPTVATTFYELGATNIVGTIALVGGNTFASTESVTLNGDFLNVNGALSFSNPGGNVALGFVRPPAPGPRGHDPLVSATGSLNMSGDIALGFVSPPRPGPRGNEPFLTALNVDDFDLMFYSTGTMALSGNLSFNFPSTFDPAFGDSIMLAAVLGDGGIAIGDLNRPVDWALEVRNAIYLAANVYNQDGSVSSINQLGTGSVLFARYAPVPEPGTMLLLGSGLIGLAGAGRRKRAKSSPV